MRLEAVKSYIKPAYLVAAMRNLRAAWHFLRRVRADYTKIADAVGLEKKQFRLYLREIREQRDFNKSLRNKAKSLEGQLVPEGLALGSLPFDVCIFIYGLVRSLEPDVILETGVASGMSSSYLLAALQANGHGKLYSIDLPHEPDNTLEQSPKSTEQYPLSKEQTGWLAPSELRSRWTLLIGKSSEVLPGTLRDLREIDIFLHDSAHTYENMMFEYKAVWPHIKMGGCITF